MRYALVDDAQDLDSISLEIIARIADHVTLVIEEPGSDFNRMSLEQACSILRVSPDRVLPLPVYTGIPAEQRPKPRTSFTYGEGMDDAEDEARIDNGEESTNVEPTE